ncbi:MAG: DsrE family protein [Thermodesulfovibrionales bacterium]
MNIECISKTAALSEDLEGLKEVKVVWDITIGDAQMFADRINLILQTAESFRKRGITPCFVIAIHGPATKFATRSLAGTVFEKENAENMPDIRKILEELTQSGARIQQCEITLLRGNISGDSILPFISTEENVLVNIAALQNKGYAYMPFHVAEPLIKPRG